MSELLRVGIIGCGKPWGSDGATGTGIANEHAKGYKQNPDRVRIVGLADIVLAHAEAFRERHGGDRVYSDYAELLEKEQLDMVSICTWPGLHAPMVEAAAKAGVKAILCEKPMAPTWAEAKRMKAVADEHGVLLALNHQRRFDAPYVRAKELLAGPLGTLRRLEMQCDNLFDWGTHWFDMANFLNGEAVAEWVLCQCDPTGGPSFFGVTMESDGITRVQYENGVTALFITGKNPGWGAQIRLWGEHGCLEIGATGWDSLRWWAPGQTDWVEETLPRGEEAPNGFALAIRDIADALVDGHEPELSVNKAIRSTEVMFGAYESARSGGRVRFPAEFADSGIHFVKP